MKKYYGIVDFEGENYYYKSLKDFNKARINFKREAKEGGWNIDGIDCYSFELAKMRKDDLVLALLSQTGFVSNKKEITP
jgi:hypothetical protein